MNLSIVRRSADARGAQSVPHMTVPLAGGSAQKLNHEALHVRAQAERGLRPGPANGRLRIERCRRSATAIDLGDHARPAVPLLPSAREPPNSANGSAVQTEHPIDAFARVFAILLPHTRRRRVHTSSRVEGRQRNRDRQWYCGRQRSSSWNKFGRRCEIQY